MLKNKKFVALALSIVLIFTFSCLLFSCNKKVNDKTIKLIEVTHSVFYAPLYVAIENGYFEEEGIEVELKNGGGADNCMTALLTNAADIGLMGPEAAIYIHKEGKKDLPIIFAQLTTKDGSFLMSREKDDNFDFSKLEGKEIIGGRKGGVPALSVERVLKLNNLIDGTNVTINYNVEYDLIGSAFQAGTGDYCTMFEPAASNMEKAGIGYIVASIGKAAGNYPYTAFMALQSYLNNNNEKITAFTKAIIKGMEYVNTHSEKEIAQIVEKQFNGTSLEILESSIKSYKDIDAYSLTPIMLQEDFDRLQEVIIDGKIIDSKIDFNKIVDNSIAKGILNNEKHS